MNTTTFTIESVHGVKQTFVLNIQNRAVTALAGKEKPIVIVGPIKTELSSPQNPPSPTRS